MDELDRYGTFNTRYEGIGRLYYVGKENVPVTFEARQLADGRILIGCVAIDMPISDGPSALDGHLLSGEPFSTIWGRGIKEIFRSDGKISKVHYVATMTRVRYTQVSQPDDHAAQFALHNFIPGRHTDISGDAITISLPKGELRIVPVGNYQQQRDQLLRVGGNLRTSWAKTTPAGGSPRLLHECIDDILTPLSLALGTKVTAPQLITFDANGERNDVEHYTTPPAPFSNYIAAQEWDAPIKDTVEGWFIKKDHLIPKSDIAVTIHQHLDSCSTAVYLETRALVAATLLDVIAGRYASIWASGQPLHRIAFARKLSRLLHDLDISLAAPRINAVIQARNSLVHAGRFTGRGTEQFDIEYHNLLLLGRSILFRLVGVRSTLHDAIKE